MMRFSSRILTLAALITTQACYGIGALEALGGSCDQEQLVATWPVTITRGASVTGTLLTTTLTPDAISNSEFQALRQALVQGAPPSSYNVTWNIPAFNSSGGYVSLRHPAPISAGTNVQVGATFTGGTWSAQSATSFIVPAIAVRADNFTATSASGSISAIDDSPVRLGIDITTSNAAGETIRLTGEVGFAYQKVTKTCVG